MQNIDKKTVASFGEEWSHFDQLNMPEKESYTRFLEYFSLFPWEKLSLDSEGFDMGCGSGRWAHWVAPRVGKLNCIDPSNAINIARKNLLIHNNIIFYQKSVDSKCLPSNSQDFGYSLGVLHHVPNTAAAIKSCVDLLKPGAPMLLYLYYAFDNRPGWYRILWRLSDIIRKIIYRLPNHLKHFFTDIIAILIYLPLALFSKATEKIGINVTNFPLSYYRNCSFYTMRTDARDRFGTPLEKRFFREKIKEMMISSGLENITFSESPPYWCVIGKKIK
jgi:SAM-dependent methyltransferase